MISDGPLANGSQTPESAARRSVWEREVTVVRAALSQDAFAAAWAEGRAMTLEQAVAYALDEQPSA